MIKMEQDAAQITVLARSSKAASDSGIVRFISPVGVPTARRASEVSHAHSVHCTQIAERTQRSSGPIPEFLTPREEVYTAEAMMHFILDPIVWFKLVSRW